MKVLRRLIAWLCIVFTVVFLVLQMTPIMPWYAGRLAGNWTDSDGDILIVLSSEAEKGDVIGLSSYWRSIYAIRAWRAGHFRTVVVSGGPQPGIVEPRAVIIGRFLESNGIPHDRVLLESTSESTRENALFTSRLLANMPGRKVLLTSDYHMFRARGAFEAAGLTVVPRPFPDVIKQSNNWLNREYCFGILVAETAKIAGYWWNGWLGAH
jgi:uncharacterized SAM-binding protein YcdF (DUF218 family)